MATAQIGKIKSDSIHYKSFAMVSAVALEDCRLSPRDKITYCTICDISRGAAHLCYASAETIARRATLGRTSVFQALTHLEALGYISRKSRNGRTDIVYISTLPVYDFDSSLYGGELAKRWQTVDKLCAKIVENRTSDYLMFDTRSARVQFMNGCEPQDEHDIEELIKIIEGYTAAFPDMPTGMEKKRERLDVLDIIQNRGYSSDIVTNIVEFVNKSSFVRGNNTRHEKKTLRWIIQNLDDCLDPDSRYLDYEFTEESVVHQNMRAATSCCAMQAADN